MKHKHCELIKAWADGSDIEHWCPFRNKWIDFPSEDLSDWNEDFKYRIKPEPKPDVKTFLFKNERCWMEMPYGCFVGKPLEGLIITRDGETGELKSAEVIK